MMLMPRMFRRVLLVAFALAVAACTEEMPLDRAPVRTDARSLQHGAQVFVNYCLNCHGASAMRYNRLRDIGISEALIRDNLMFAADRSGETMRVAMRRQDAKLWFGAAPPDLSVVARARGADWLYSYLRKFYVDETRPTGWNNEIFPNVGMPHALWQLQGKQEARFKEETDAKGNKSRRLEKLVLTTPGQLSVQDYDRTVGDLVSYLVWMGEPAQEFRKQIGIVVLIVLGALCVLTYLLKRAYWKDIH